MTDESASKARDARRSLLSVRRATGRLSLSTAAGIIGVLIVPWSVPWFVRAVVAWDLASLTLMALAWHVIIRADAHETKRRASVDDPGRTTVFFIALISSLVSLFASTFVLKQIKVCAATLGDSTMQTTWTLLTLAAVALSWALTHTAYTLRYAHLHYRRDVHGGLQFPGDDPPADIDFAYFSFTIGMCFQTSDVTATSTRLRRAVLLHAVLSFIYNTTILALALNLAFGLMS